MLYLVGGAARSGKTIIARRMLERQSVPYFSVDYLISGLSAGSPDPEMLHELPNQTRGERIWPVLSGLLRNIVEVETSYLVEGDSLLPSRVAEFSAQYAGRVRACFLGYARCDVEEKCFQARCTPSPVNDWVAGLSDANLAALICSMREFSSYLEQRCAQLDLRYFDSSTGFTGTLDGAYDYLVGAT